MVAALTGVTAAIPRIATELAMMTLKLCLRVTFPGRADIDWRPTPVVKIDFQA
ncbi:hypothetical protein ABT173_41960 [Streptomyces sp. NPDC001795]|uniref:hypothetical protein n=1 Tax=Streptomyces sp. NPDC001795 TaxID=3154525 RepID=UPI00332E7053